MVEKVSMNHPNKKMDRVVGAIVDLAYTKKKTPRIKAVSSLYNNVCEINIHSDLDFKYEEIDSIVKRICGEEVKLELMLSKVEPIIRKHCTCGGGFKGVYPKREEIRATHILGAYCGSKLVGSIKLDSNSTELCVSNFEGDIDKINNDFDIYEVKEVKPYEFNEIAHSNAELVSDMGESTCGTGIHGVDLCNPNITLAMYAWIMSQKHDEAKVLISCEVGDTKIGNRTYSSIINRVKKEIDLIGGFEKLAEWGYLKPWAAIEQKGDKF